MDNDCVICCQKYGKRRKKAYCPNCSYECCNYCVRDYLRSNDADCEISCMNCKYVFEESFLYSDALKSNERDINIHRENTLYKKKQHYSKKLDTEANNRRERNKLLKIIAEQKDEMKELRSKMFELKCNIIENTIQANKFLNFENAVNYKQICPLENCGGKIKLDSICDKCNSKICCDCDCKMEENHECDENLKLNIADIKKHTTPCPNCGTRIHKIADCNDMFCIICKTKFNYKNGEVITRPIHNPHQTDYNKQIILSECNPVGRPTNEMIKRYNIDPNIRKFIPPVYDLFVSRVGDLTSSIVSIENDDGRIHFVNELLGSHQSLTKRNLLLDYKQVKIMKTIRDYYNTHIELITECLWKLYDVVDNETESHLALDELKKILVFHHHCLSKFKYDKRYSRYTEIHYYTEQVLK